MNKMKSLTDTYTMKNGVKIHCVGFGTWQTPNDEVGYNAVKKALEVGYRHIDTAAVYRNEESVGQAIADSGIPREELFVTTKVWNEDRGYEETRKAFELSLQKLQMEYVDLYLIHWPNPISFREQWQKMNSETWRAIEDLYEEGKIRSIGISNFRIHHIEELLKTAKIVPMVNQIRVCPGDYNKELIEYCKEKGMLIEAYSPLGTGKVFAVDVLQKIAEAHHTDIAKVVLSWVLNHGLIPLPKSVTPKRIEDNSQFFDIELTEEEMNNIDNLDGVCGYATDPDLAGY